MVTQLLRVETRIWGWGREWRGVAVLPCNSWSWWAWEPPRLDALSQGSGRGPRTVYTWSYFFLSLLKFFIWRSEICIHCNGQILSIVQWILTKEFPLITHIPNKIMSVSLTSQSSLLGSVNTLYCFVHFLLHWFLLLSLQFFLLLNLGLNCPSFSGFST